MLIRGAVRWLVVCAGVLVLELMPGSALAEGGLSVDVMAAWNGVSRPGVYSEIGVRLQSPESRKVSLEIGAPAASVIATVDLQAGEPRTVWIPYRASYQSPLVLRAHSEGELLIDLKRSLFEPAVSGKIVALALAGPRSFNQDAHRLPGAQLLPVAVSALPRTAQAYDVVTALVIDGAALVQLKPDQLRALQGYLNRCGRLLVIGIPEGLRSELRKFAGCGGAFMEARQKNEAIPEALVPLLTARPPALPTARDLTGLETNSNGFSSYLIVGVFIFAYFASMIAVSSSTQLPWLLIAIPIVVAALVVVAWRSGPPKIGLISWMEIERDEPNGRYAGLLRVEGRGRGTFALVIPPFADIAAPLPESAVRHIYFERDGTATVAIEVSTHLFSRHNIYLQGAGLGQSPLFAEIRSGQPTIRNRSADTTAPAVLAWKGKRYIVPQLAPGEDWVWRHDLIPMDAGTVSPLLEKQTREQGSGLLMPFVPVLIRGMGAAASPEGWLLRHFGDEPERQSP